MLPTQRENEITQPTELRDFFEWHQGIKYYGFWAIEVQSQQCLQQLNRCQQAIADTLHPHYLRQAHITLSPSGLLDEKHFTEHDLQQQIEVLKQHIFRPSLLAHQLPIPLPRRLIFLFKIRLTLSQVYAINCITFVMGKMAVNIFPT